MGYLKRHWRRIGLSLALLLPVLTHTLDLVPIPALDRVDATIYDARLRATMPLTLDDRIVIIDVDEKSLAEQGRWPWSRQKMAALTHALFEKYQIALLGFDVVFAEPDDSSGLKQLQALAKNEFKQDAGFVAHVGQLAPSLEFDRLFAASLAHRKVVLGYYFTSEQDGGTSGVLPAPVMQGEGFSCPSAQFKPWHGFGANIPLLAQAVPLAGFFNSLTDPDGVVRALPLLARHADKCYESLALAMFRQLTGLPQVMPGWAPGASGESEPVTLQHIVLKWPDKTYSIPVDERGAAWVPYRGNGGAQGGSFTYVSATDVLAGKVPAHQLRGKIVLVGSTAPGAVDLRTTPVAAAFPGVEVQANALASLLDRRFLASPLHAKAYDALWLVLTALVLACVLPGLTAPVTVAVSVGVVVSLVAMNWWLYVVHGMVVRLAPMLLMTGTVAVVNLGYGYLAASRVRRELIALFGTYVPSELVQEMAKDPAHNDMRAKSEELTVMFCDLRGFTRMCEQLDPLQLQQSLNQVFSEMTQLIGANRGTVDKYMGDCVMAFWGAPVALPDHANLAVKTAMQMMQALARINQTPDQKTSSQLDPRIGLGIGLSTGRMYVGDMGSNIRRSYTVIGDAVNLGARLEGLSKVYGVTIVASQATQAQATDYAWQELDRVRVKGRQQAVTVFTPIALKTDLSAEKSAELALWQIFLEAYRAQNHEQRDVLLGQLLNLDATSQLYTLYAARIAAARGHTIDPGWDGITNFETK